MNLAFSDVAWGQYLYWQETDRAMLRKVNTLIKDCLRHPLEGTGKPEPLKYLGADVWSRRITQEHRCVYLIKPDRIEFLQGRYHY